MVELHGASQVGKTTVARLLCQLMPAELPGLFLDGGADCALASALMGQKPPFSTLAQSCQPLLTGDGLLELEAEEIDWRVADAVMTLGERLDVLVQGTLPRALKKSSDEMMAYGVKRLWGQYAWAVSDEPDPKMTQWLQAEFQPVGVALLSAEHTQAVWQETLASLRLVYPINKLVVLMNSVPEADKGEARIEPCALERWMYQYQREENVRCIGKLPLINEQCPDPLGRLLPALQSSLYHLNMPFQPSV